MLFFLPVVMSNVFLYLDINTLLKIIVNLKTELTFNFISDVINLTGPLMAIKWRYPR